MVLPVLCFVFQTGSRYDAQVAVFGSEFQKKLSEKKYFIVSSIFHKVYAKGTPFLGSNLPGGG